MAMAVKMSSMIDPFDKKKWSVYNNQYDKKNNNP
jgi:hypothetical protein